MLWCYGGLIINSGFVGLHFFPCFFFKNTLKQLKTARNWKNRTKLSLLDQWRLNAGSRDKTTWPWSLQNMSQQNIPSNWQKEKGVAWAIEKQSLPHSSPCQYTGWFGFQTLSYKAHLFVTIHIFRGIFPPEVRAQERQIFSEALDLVASMTAWWISKHCRHHHINCTSLLHWFAQKKSESTYLSGSPKSLDTKAPGPWQKSHSHAFLQALRDSMCFCRFHSMTVC